MNAKLKKLSPRALQSLAADIRAFLIRSLSDTGGHLASNLGVVELTLALHAVFDTPKDKLVWDVGHQSYVHKILTGRRGRFHTLRKLDGLSGFPKVCESPHDAFGTGHSSTAISAALGLAMARAPRDDGKIVAIVGDGSMTGGQAYEGLNNAGRSNTDLLVILNDNQMSIGENVGAISRHLNDIRTTPVYLGAKQGAHKLLDNLPVVGPTLYKAMESTKDVLKYMLIKGVLFEELGFRYFGPIDGHDAGELIEVLKRIKNIPGPVLLHVLTQKGKGYRQAEIAPAGFHGVEPFQIETGRPTNGKRGMTYTDAFAECLCEHAAADPRIVAVTAAMHDGTGLSSFRERFPNRFYDVGIAEAHAVTFAAGMAMGGKRPVVAVYSSFLQRAYDQILHDVALQRLPVVFAIDRAGIVGEDGETHQGLYDLAFLSHIPNMAVLAPANGPELKAMLAFALAHDGPVAIRYPRGLAKGEPSMGPLPPIVYGQAETVTQGRGIALVSVGTMMETALEVAENLRGEGHEPGLYNARFVKPVDKELAERLMGYGHVFVLQDAVRAGGYGAALLEVFSGFGKPMPRFHDFAFPDKFIEAGTQTELFARYQLDASGITKYIKEKILR